MNTHHATTPTDLQMQVASAFDRFYVARLSEQLARAAARNPELSFFELPPGERDRLQGIARAALRQAQGGPS